MTITEASEALGISVKTVRRRIVDGELKAEKVRGKWLVEVGQVGANGGQVTDQSVVESLRQEVKHQRELLARADTQLQSMREQVADLKQELTEKNQQLSRRDEEVQQLHQIIAMQQRSIDRLTEQKQLDDKRRHWWQRIWKS